MQIVVSFSFALSFHLTTKEDREEVKECSRELVYFLDYFIAYLFFVTTRHMVILFLLFCVKRPQRLRDFAFIVYIVLDIFFVMILTTYGTTIIFSDEALNCRQGSDYQLRWFVMSMFCLIFGWIYSVFLCIMLASAPIIVAFWCFYKM